MIQINTVAKKFLNNALSILLVFCFILFTRLSYWQYQRGLAKTLVMQKISNLANAKPKPLTTYLKDINDTDYLRFKAVTLTGKFLLPNILLENQFHNHNWGFRIFSPFQLENTNYIVLVDRGWQGAISRNNLPIIPLLNSTMIITGYINLPSQGIELIKSGLPNREKATKAIQLTHINFKKLDKYFKKELLPFNVTLFKSLPSDQFIIPSAKVNMPASKHYGYSLQWLALAIVTVIYLLCKKS